MFNIGPLEIKSRLLLGTGKFEDEALMVQC
jgi:thiazole synthase